MEDRLRTIRAKIERAKHHINDLEVLIKGFKESKIYQIVVKSDPKTGENVHWLEILKKIPLVIPVITGEAVHHLRSSLDHLAWQLVEANHATAGDWTGFPICDSPPKEKRQFLGKVEGMSPTAIDMIDASQPYKTGSNSLSRIRELDNINKHRHRLEFIFWRSGFTLEASYQDGTIDPRTIILPGLHQSSMISENGTELFRIPDTFDMKYDLKLTFDIAFGEPKIVEGNAVLKLLEKSANIVDCLIGKFASLPELSHGELPA